MSSERLTRRLFLARTCGGSIAATCGALVLSGPLAALPVREIDGLSTGQDRAYPIPAADSVSIDRSQAVIIVRHQGKVFALNLTCPHQNAAVKWLEKDGRFQCTKHDSKYTQDGVYMSGRSTRNLDRFVVHQNGASLVVSLDKVIQADKDPAGWAAAAVPV